jgi:hypothetical protein
MDLIRDLLIYFATKRGSKHVLPEDIKIDGRTNEAFGYHLRMLYQAEFLSAEAIRTNTGRIINVIPFELTWRGHEFLATVRDDEVWRQTKVAAKRIGAFSVEAIADLAKSMLKKKIGDLTNGEFTL